MRPYLELAKPERTLANVLTAVAGYFLASTWPPRWSLLAATLTGITLVIASACVANNVMDRELDKQMARTSRRALPNNIISTHAAVVFAFILGAAGFAVLALWVNTLVVLLGVIAYVDYVAAYGWTKRHTVWSTWIGTPSGSLSLVAGYCAVTDRLDRVALLLFLLMVFWQMAHFYAIGIYRLKDYRAGKLPIWPSQYGLDNTRRQIVAYIMLFLLSAMSLTLAGQTGLIYLLIVLLLGLNWLRVALRLWQAEHEAAWARTVFGQSLVVVTALPLLLALGPHLP